MTTATTLTDQQVAANYQQFVKALTELTRQYGIALQKAFIQSLPDEILENLHHINPRLDWIARSIVKEQQNSDSIA